MPNASPEPYPVQEQYRPRRSVLYVPGINDRALNKAATLPADCVILDLEDSVGPDQKEAARNQVEAVLDSFEFGNREVIVRVNGLDTKWGKSDIGAVASMRINGILLPKVDGPRQLEGCRGALQLGGAPDNLPIWIMAETPLGLLQLDEILTSNQKITTVVMGNADLGKALGIPRGAERRGLAAHRARAVLIAKARGVDILDGVETDFSNMEAFRAACEEGRDMGFTGKTVIHPNQVTVANEVFGISTDQVAEAVKIIEAWKVGQSKGDSVVVVDGTLVEELHYEQALKTLAVNRAIGNRKDAAE